MVIDFVRSGGFAGLRVTAHVDVDALEPADRASWRDLVDAADFFRLQPAYRGAAPDAFRYTVRVENGAARHEVVADERAVPAGLRPLIDRLAAVARRPAP